MKTEFELEVAGDGRILPSPATISIIGKEPNHSPYVSITVFNTRQHFLRDKDLERFAVNILKALNSKKLKSKKGT